MSSALIRPNFGGKVTDSDLLEIGMVVLVSPVLDDDVRCLFGMVSSGLGFR